MSTIKQIVAPYNLSDTYFDKGNNTALKIEYKLQYTIANLRTASNIPDVVFITDSGFQGIFQYDSIDTSTIDNGTSVFVNGTKRFKKISSSTDSFLLARVNHVGVQSINTVTGLQNFIDSKSNVDNTNDLNKPVSNAQATINNSLQSSITTNTANIATNASNVSTNTSNITANSTAISTNTSNIATNATNIATATNTANNAVSIANTANLQGVRLGAYNASTNTPTLTTDASAVATGGFYNVTVAGTQSITGTSTLFGVSDRLAKVGSAWVRLPFEVADNSITNAKTTFIKQITGKNKFNLATTQDGYYLDQTGYIAASASFLVSDFIPVTAGIQYVGNVSMRFTTYYDANKTLVTGGSGSPISTFTIPSGVAFIKVTINLSSKNAFQFESGIVSSTYESYFENTTLIGVKNPVKSIDNTQIVDNTLGIDKLNFLQVGKNLFNKNNPINKTNFYILSTDGSEQSGGGSTATHFIPVTAGLTYTPTIKNQLAFYDINKAYISGLTGGRTDTYFTVPANVSFVRLTIATAALNTLQLELGTVSTTYENYFLSLIPSTLDPIYSIGLTTAGIAQVQAGLVVTSSMIPNNTISAIQTNFLKVGKNKFNINASDVTIGSYVLWTDGSVQGASVFNITGFIPVTPGTTYTLSYKNQSAWFDINKNYISGDNSNGATLNAQITAPANAVFLRTTVFNTFWTNFQVEEGISATAWEKYGFILDPAKILSPIDITTLQTIFQTNATRPIDIAIAPKLYTLNNTEIAVYYENVHKYFDNYRGKSEVIIANGKSTGRAIKFVPTAIGTTTAVLNTANEKFETVSAINTSVISVNPTNTTAVNVLNIGDSYTLGSTFVNKLQSITSNVNFVGMRGTSVTGVNAEGRGGYSLGTYTGLSKNNTQFSPFMQPSSVHKFYGVTGFWKIVNGAGGYDWGLFDSVKALFNTSTGYLISPAVNDVVYDDALAGFYTWNGSAWVTITEATLAFTFNFAKYRTVWNIALPKIVHSLFGTNDWASASETDITNQWATWKANMDLVITSIKADNSATRIIIGIPNSSGKQGEDDVLWTAKRKRAFWYHAKQIIANYAGREAENIYVADYHSIIDRQFAFNTTDELPFANYTGAYRDRYKADAVHISNDGYNQMGNMYAALIQFLR